MLKLWWIGFGLLVCAGGLRAAEGAATEPPFRVLVFTKTTGYRHSSIETSVAELTRLGETSGRFTVDQSEDLAALAPERLAPYRVVFFSNTTGNWPLSEAQRAGFLEWVRAGGGVVGAHAATDTAYDWPAWGELFGGWFDGHPWHQEVGVIVEDPDHPAAAGLPSTFRVTDEIYQHRNWSRDNVHVILRLDTETVDLTRPGVRRTDGDFGLAWCRTFGEGRSFYTALGHREEIWRDPRLLPMFLGAILWAARAEDGAEPAEAVGP